MHDGFTPPPKPTATGINEITIKDAVAQATNHPRWAPTMRLLRLVEDRYVDAATDGVLLDAVYHDVGVHPLAVKVRAFNALEDLQHHGHMPTIGVDATWKLAELFRTFGLMLNDVLNIQKES